MRRPSQRGIKIGAAALLLGTLLTGSSWAKWMAPMQVPVARLLKNVSDYIQEHPKEAQGYYTLGRINSLAFATETETIGVYKSDPLPNIPNHSGYIPPPRDKNKPLSPQAAVYLAEALRNYSRATSLDAKNGLAWLGLGFQCEEAIPYPKAVVKAGGEFARSKPLDAEDLRRKAISSYRKAYTLTIKADSIHPDMMINPVSMEAAQGIVRLQANHRLSSAEQTELETIQTQILEFKKRPRAITPLLISFDRQASLPDLLAPEKHVRFDLAGDGLGRSWPWVKPTTGILVWDPKHTGKITSGLQLFGNVTWWLFWKDGYEPLAALDNNHNGWLEGAELQGICVWFDRNSNGVTDRGEVVPLSSLGIKRIAAHSAGLTDGVPANPDGVQLRDGSSLATFDWTPTSLTK